MKKPVALFDMDNTLFAYEQQLRHDLELLNSPGEEVPENIFDESILWLKRRMDLIKSVPGWWRNLPKYKPGWEIYTYVKAIGFECHILTKGPKTKPHAWAEKCECIQNHFGLDINIDIVGKDKSATYGRVLVDDYPPYVKGWLKYRPRGLAILPAHKYNEDFSHPNAIRYTGDNGDEVAAAIRAAKEREHDEHWKDRLK